MLVSTSTAKRAVRDCTAWESMSALSARNVASLATIDHYDYVLLRSTYIEDNVGDHICMFAASRMRVYARTIVYCYKRLSRSG